MRLVLFAATALALGASVTVSLKVPAELSCPSTAALTERLTRAGLSVVPLYAELEVELVPATDGYTLKARRQADGKVFERQMKSTGETCETLGRLTAVLIHSWARLRLPPLGPGVGKKDGGP